LCLAATSAAGESVQVDKPVPAAVDWQSKLQAAMGDDSALLALAREGAPIDVKMAAVGALTSEASLKLAEREHRDRDRRVHRLAKQRLLAQVALRETGEQADRLIDAAKELVDVPLIPANRLVDLDRAWRALNATLLSDTQRCEFDALLAQLSTLTRERGDHTLKIERWTAEARHALAQLQTACSAAADTQDRSQLTAAIASAQAVVEAAPDGDTTSTLRDSLRDAVQNCAEFDERLAVLDDILQTETPQDAPLRWQQLPPLADARLSEMVNRRFEQWQQARDHAQQTRRVQRRERVIEREQGVRKERTETLATVLEQAEAALAAGHVADTNKHLVDIDELLREGASADALRARIDALQAEYARLKGWQQWGGGLAREELVLQAEALASASVGEADARILKLSIKQQAEVIDDLRARWKELDRLGGATNRSLWQRFDAALKTAYEPVAEHFELQRAARQQNLVARDQLVEALNAVAVPEVNDGASVPDWKSLAAALDQFQAEWRKLGPLEHTVPHKDRGKLVERMSAAVQRLEAPLTEARRVARLARERLITRAEALTSEAGAGAQARDVVGKVRELQAEWQQQAKALPLTRAVENALWAEFKTHIDAVFSAREAVFSARDAEFKSNGAERAALIDRLLAITADTPPAELKRTLAEVDAQWQRTGPAPRSDAAALDSRFNNAREAVRQYLAANAQRNWDTNCDALEAKLAMCEELERSASPTETRAAIEQRWKALPTLQPAVWERALAERASLVDAAQSGNSRIPASTDDLLMQLEAAFQLDSPPEFQAARREMKLQAMKAALEGRQSLASTPLAPDELLAAALGRTPLDGPQRERLGKVIAAVRSSARPGAA